MASVDLVASTVLQAAASLMNDTARTVYFYSATIPYLRIAMNELQEYFQLHDIPATQNVSAIINVPAVATPQIVEIGFNGLLPIPSLPDDMIEPQQLWESSEGQDTWVPLTRREYIPQYLTGELMGQFIWYAWQNQKIKVLGANADIDIKIDYLKELFAQLVDENSQINVINARTFLEYRTAGLLAEFIERNKPSADSLNVYASLALDRATGIGVKSKQAIQTRRRPFRSGYRRTRFIT